MRRRTSAGVHRSDPREEVLGFDRTKAREYNDTGGIPFTCVVNPHTLEEMTRWAGGTPMGDVVEGITAARKALDEANGEGFSRKNWNSLIEAEDAAWEKVAKGDYQKALGALDKVARKATEWPETIRQRLDGTRKEIVDTATKALDEIERLATTDAAAAKKELAKFRSKLKGTGLEERVEALYASLQG